MGKFDIGAVGLFGFVVQWGVEGEAEVEDDEAIWFAAGVFEKRLQRMIGRQQVQGTTLVVCLLLSYHKVAGISMYLVAHLSFDFTRYLCTIVDVCKMEYKIRLILGEY